MNNICTYIRIRRMDSSIIFKINVYMCVCCMLDVECRININIQCLLFNI